MIFLRTHDVAVETASNNPPDRIEYAAPVSFIGNLQPIGGSQTQVSLGIEGQAMYTLFLDRLSDADLNRFKLSSKVTVNVIGSAIEQSFFVHSEPIVHGSNTELEHIEIVLKEDVFV